MMRLWKISFAVFFAFLVSVSCGTVSAYIIFRVAYSLLGSNEHNSTHHTFYAGRSKMWAGDDNTSVEAFLDPAGQWQAVVYSKGPAPAAPRRTPAHVRS